MITTTSEHKAGFKVASENRAFSAKELATFMGKTRQGVEYLAASEKWFFEAVKVRGGVKKLFPIKRLPIDIRKKVMIGLGELPAEFADLVPIDFDRTKIAACAKDYDEASPWQRDLARDRLEILERLDTFREQYMGRRSMAVQSFVETYLNREVEGIDPAIYRKIPIVKRSRLYDWESRFRQHGIAGLISRHGSGHKGSCGFPAEQQQFVLGTLAQNPSLKPYKIQRSLLARFGKAAMSRRQVGDFLKRRKAADPVVFAHLKDPDAAKGKYQLALGSASEKAERFLHYIEVDSTPADVMCADGKRYTIVGGIDIYSRKAKFVVTKTSNSWAIAGLIREISTDWGLPETIVRDNGQDYASKMVNDGLLALGVKVVAVPPFTPEGKPHIERVFRTLSHDLLETLPGYIGHNVAERKAIENRKSFAERLGKAGAKKGRKILYRRSGFSLTLADTRLKPGLHQEADTRLKPGLLHQEADTRLKPGPHEESDLQTPGLTAKELQTAINKWTEDVYHQRTHSGIKMSPNAKASRTSGKDAASTIRNRRIDDPRVLDRLLAESGNRIIGKKGLRYESGLFWNDALIDWMGRQVTVRTDLRDASKVFCFDPDTRRFICEAQDLALEGITLADKIQSNKRAKKRVREGVKAIKVLGASVGDPFADEIALIRQERALVRNLPVGGIVEDNLFIAGVRESIKAEDENREEPRPPEEPEWAPVERQRHRMLKEATSWRMYNPEPKKIIPLQSRNEEQVDRIWFDTPLKKFDYYRAKAAGGDEIDEQATLWLQKYADEWRAYADMFSEDWLPQEKVWIAQLAPHYFGQYLELVKEEEKTEEE